MKWKGDAPGFPEKTAIRRDFVLSETTIRFLPGRF